MYKGLFSSNTQIESLSGLLSYTGQFRSLLSLGCDCYFSFNNFQCCGGENIATNIIKMMLLLIVILAVEKTGA